MATSEPHEEPLGPEYRADKDKPKATVSCEVPAHDNVLILPQTPQLIALLT